MKDHVKFQFWNLVYCQGSHHISATRPLEYAENEFWAEMYWLNELHEARVIPDVNARSVVRAELITNYVPIID